MNKKNKKNNNVSHYFGQIAEESGTENLNFGVMVTETGNKFKDPSVAEAAEEEAPWAFNTD